VPTTTTLGKTKPSFSQTLYIKSQGPGKTKRKMPGRGAYGPRGAGLEYLTVGRESEAHPAFGLLAAARSQKGEGGICPRRFRENVIRDERGNGRHVDYSTKIRFKDKKGGMRFAFPPYSPYCRYS
jgi:hypothetical protein